MATKLEKPLEREVGGLIVTLAPEGIYIREKGRRLKVGPLGYGVLYQRGVVSALPSLRNSKRVTRGLLSTRDPIDG